MNDIRMRKFVDMHYPTYREIKCEFLSSLNVVQSNNGPIMHFRLYKRNVSLTYVEFANFFELDHHPPTQWHEDYKADDIYLALSGKPCPNSQHASAVLFHHPVPKIF